MSGDDSELPELREPAQWTWDNDPANKDEAEFWFEVPFRKKELEAEKVSTKNDRDMTRAERNKTLWHIDEAIDALPIDEDEVRTAPPGELKARIQRVRKRWKEADGLIATLGAPSKRPVAKDLGPSHNPSDEMKAWYAVWQSDHPQASDTEVEFALPAKFKDERFTREMLRNLVNPDKVPRKRGKKPGKTDKEHVRRMRQTAN